MARPPRDARLETREARSKLKQSSVPYWRHIHTGLALGYYKGKKASAWYVRRARLPHEAGTGRWKLTKLGLADDLSDADGIHSLSYRQAVTLAMGRSVRAETGPEARTAAAAAGKAPTPAAIQRSQEGISAASYTVADCIADYLAALSDRKGEAHKNYNLKLHVLPAFGSRAVASLTTEELQRWHDRLIHLKRDGSKAALKPGTAKRIWSNFRAALNLAFRYEKVPSDTAWRRVKTHRKADVARLVYLTAPEAKRLINACDPEFRPIARAALLTGARWGELTALQVRDFDPQAKTVHFVDKTKSGRDKYVPLTDEGAIWFAQWSVGRKSTDLIFSHADGSPWGQSHQIRRMKEATRRAKVKATFHTLRHTYGSLLAQKGVPLKFIAQALGHVDTRMVEIHYAHLQKSNEVAKAIRAKLPSFGKAKPGNVVGL